MTGRRSNRWLAGLISATLLATSLTSAPVAAGRPAGVAVPDPERDSTVVTPWGWHYNVTPATMNAFIATGYRIIDLEVRSSSPTFTVAYVRDAGVYDRTWWWYYGQTAAQVNAHISANGARLIDIEPYRVSGALRFAVVMVANTGVAQKAWWWYYGLTVATIGSNATSLGARPIDIDRYSTASGDRFTTILIQNVAPDDKGWAHLYNVTPAQIGAYITNNSMRLLSLERTPYGTFDAVLQSAGSENWWWYYGVSASQLAQFASQQGARIYRIEPYGSSFAALLINNVNAETTRIRDLIGNDLNKGSWGFYVKKLGGSVVISLQGNTIFEPASAIKAVHAVTALRKVKSRVLSLTSNLTWYAAPGAGARYVGDPNYASDKNICAYTNAGVLQTANTYSDDLGPVIIKQMLEQSDNRNTDAITRKWGFAALNATIALAGMNGSQVHHRIGCPEESSPQPWHHNELTPRDIAHLYELVQDGTLLGTGSLRDTFWEYMAGGPISTTGALANMIEDEAALAGLSGADQTLFISNVIAYSKGGSYGLCPDVNNPNPCNPPTVQIRTTGGIIWLPFRGQTGGLVPTAYVYSRFLDDWTSNCTWAMFTANTCGAWNTASAALTTLALETFRAIVKQALATW